MKNKSNWLKAFYTLFSKNSFTFTGSLFSTVSAVCIIWFILAGLIGYEFTPYSGIMIFLVLPTIFVLGIIIILIGIYYDHKKMKKAAELKEIPPYPNIDLNDPHTRKMFSITIIIVLATFIVLSVVFYRSVDFMESVTFCGKVCHTVMEPEYVSYTNSPHARVECVKCHIGPGAPWFVKSKISGIRQVFAVIAHSYHKPIPTPVENLRPSRDTCEQCHWPERFSGDRLKIYTKYDPDEKNTARVTVLDVHIGGGQFGKGIHSWHIDKTKKTTYIASDRERQKIEWVKVEDGKGNTTIYKSPAGQQFNESDIEKAEKRVMDCIDCHNRPTHIYQFPDEAIDKSLASGLIDSNLPYIKKISTETLEKAKGSKEDSLKYIKDEISNYYEKNYADIFTNNKQTLEKAINEVENIYKRNIFPEMDVTWGTYPNNIGHMRFTGCFRCHDDNHISDNGKAISSNCDTCHQILAMDEENPEILKVLGKK